MAADNALIRNLGRIPWSLVSFGVAAYFGWQYYDLTQSENSPLTVKKAEIESGRTEVEALQVRLSEVEKFKKSLDARRSSLESAKAMLEERKAAVPEELDPVEFTRMVSRKAEDVGLRVVSLQPGERERKEYYQEHPFQLEFTGVYIQVYRFLQDLAAVPMIVRVEEFSMKPIGTDSARYVPLRGTMKLAAFSYLKSEVDALAPAGAGSGSAGPSPSSAPAPGQGGGE